MTILATWVTLQDRIDQFEQVIVKEKGQLLKAWIGSQIQTLKRNSKRCGYLRNNMGSLKKDCCRKPKKDDPSNGNGAVVKRKLDLTSAGEIQHQ